VSVESGSHTIAAPLSLTGDLSLSLLPSTLLNLGTVSGGSSTFSVQGGGILALTAAPAVQNLSLDVTELVFSNAMTVAPPVALQRTTVLRPASNTAVTLTGVISGSAGLTKSGSSTLTNAAANTYTGITTVNAGTLAASSLANGGLPSAVGASSASAANLVIGPATLSYTGSAATTTRGLTTDPGNSKASILSIDNDVTFGGEINAVSGAFIKRGKGTLTYTGKGATGINTLGRVESTDKSGFTAFPANGDSPTAGFGSFVITDGKMILGAPGQTNNIYNESMVGLRTTNLAGKETTGELEIRDGYTSFNSYLSVGRNNGFTDTAPTPLHPRLIVSGGTLSIASGLILGYGNLAGMNTQPILDITGGMLTTSGDFRLGDYRGTASPFATANMYGGIFRQTGTGFGIRFGGNGGADGVLNLFGGLVDTDSQVKMGLANAANISRLNLHGGVLRAQNITGSTGNEYLYFNGGVFQPRTAGQTLTGLTAATVSTNGAAFDTSLASYTVAQNLLHDTALGGATDGGLLKLGVNTLSVTGTGNTFSGLIDVREGLLQARVPSTNDLTVATNAFFDAMSLRATVHDLRGYGTLTNGVIAVTGALDAGTNNAPAGASMTVQNLSLVGGSTFVCDWTTNALGQVTNDFVTVSGTLAPEGVGFFDLGRTVENPIPMPFKATVMSYVSLSGNFAGWKAINTGVSPSRHVATVITAGGGLVTLEVRFGGTLVLLK